ncbi:MAG: hypothetical protein R2748_35505 [Bryobacterales bacterium]
MLASVGGALVSAVFALAAAANATPEQLRAVNLTIGVTAAIAALGVIAALVFFKRGHDGAAAITAIAPLPLMAAALFLLLK